MQYTWNSVKSSGDDDEENNTSEDKRSNSSNSSSGEDEIGTRKEEVQTRELRLQIKRGVLLVGITKIERI